MYRFISNAVLAAQHALVASKTQVRQLIKSTGTRLAILAILSVPVSANAAQLSVQFTDNDGPQWTGIVDTTTDTLTINTWVEGAGGRDFWTPTGPLTFKAYEAATFNTTFGALTPFDVPDGWDGSIGPDWGFLSDLTKQQISWNQGVFTANNSRLGWGISQRNDEAVVSGFNSEIDFSFVPYSNVDNFATEADSLIVKPVPEPGAVGLLGLGLALAALRRKPNKA